MSIWEICGKYSNGLEFDGWPIGPAEADSLFNVCVILIADVNINLNVP